jgi:hypothetical protein
MTTLYRAMKQDTDGMPRVEGTARGLGVRYKDDIPVDDDGICYPESGGMSVAYDSPLNLPPHRRSSDHGGTGPDPVWELDDSDLPEFLVYRQDPDLHGHGFIEPAYPMEIMDYAEALAATRTSWRINRE